MSYAARKRLRYGMGIGLEEYNSGNIKMTRDFRAELMTSSGYIGYFDTWNDTLRVFAFEDPKSRDRALKEARSIGFDSAGKIEGGLFISNVELQRPHLQNIRSKGYFYREYYR